MKYIKSENIDLIENDQEIIDRTQNIPNNRHKNKFRPSKIRKHEFDWQRDDLNKWRGPGTDTDYQVGYPSSSDGIDEAWNASNNSDVVQMVSGSGKDTIIVQKADGDPQVGETGQPYFPEEMIGKLPEGYDKTRVLLEGSGVEPADMQNAISGKYVPGSSSESIAKILDLKSQGIVFKSFEERIKEGVENATHNKNYIEILEELGLDEKVSQLKESMLINEYYLRTDSDQPDESSEDGCSGISEGVLYWDEGVVEDDFINYLNDESLLYCATGVDTNVGYPEGSVDFESYGFKNTERYSSGDIEYQVDDTKREYLLEENPIVTLKDDDDLEFQIPIKMLEGTDVFKDDYAYWSANTDQKYFSYEKDIKQLYKDSPDSFTDALSESKLSKYEKMGFLNKLGIEFKYKVEIANFGREGDLVTVDFRIKTPFEEAKSIYSFDPKEAENLKTYDDFLKECFKMYLEQIIGRGEFEDREEEFMGRMEKMAKRKKTRKVLDKVIIKKYDDFSESQDNQETENANDDFRTMQGR